MRLRATAPDPELLAWFFTAAGETWTRWWHNPVGHQHGVFGEIKEDPIPGAALIYEPEPYSVLDEQIKAEIELYGMNGIG